MAIRIGMYRMVQIEVTVSYMEIVSKNYDGMTIGGDIPCRTRDNQLAWEYVGALYNKRFRIMKTLYVRRL